MALPPTLHRSYYRSRTNQPFTAPTRVGDATSPCAAGSRWVRYAFQKADEGKTLRVSVRFNGDLVLSMRAPEVFTLTAVAVGSAAHAGWNAVDRSVDYVICGVRRVD